MCCYYFKSSKYNNMDNSLINTLKSGLDTPLLKENENTNLGKTERILSIATGTIILFNGISGIFSHPVWGLGKIVLGGSLLNRGLSGHCSVKPIIEDNYSAKDFNRQANL